MNSTYMTILGYRLETAWHGPKPQEAPTLIFLHEGLGCMEMWRDFLAKLAEATGCGAFVFSRLGYGRSDPCELPRPIHFMHHEGLTVLPEVIRAAGIRECVLIGHSDGGSISIIYAGGTEAKPVRGIITEAAHVLCEDITVRSIEGAKFNYENNDLKPRLMKYHGANTDCAFWGWNRVWLDPGFRNWNLEKYLPGIQVPMLVIQGQDDEYGTLAQVDAISRQAGKGAEVKIFPDCGHSPHKDQTEKTFAAMKHHILKILG